MSAKKSQYIILAIVFIVLTTLSGCKETSDITLENYMNNNVSVKEDIEKSISNMSGDDVSTNISFKGNTIVINETLQTVYSDKIIEKMKNSISLVDENKMKESIKQIEDISKVSNIKVNFTLLNGDGKKVFEKEYA